MALTLGRKPDAKPRFQRRYSNDLGSLLVSFRVHRLEIDARVVTEPLVCCVMLTRDRPQLAARAVRCFVEQTYENKILMVWDSSADFEPWVEFVSNGGARLPRMVHIPAEPLPTVGRLRNEANAFWTEPPILIHWDDDDWSHPNRIADQVALLQSSKAPAVGYSSLPGWESVNREAWLYKCGNSSDCLGTSMCYWRTTWERNKFTDPAGEWNHGEGVRQVGVPIPWMSDPEPQPEGSVFGSLSPLLIAEHHGGNGHCRITPFHPVTGEPNTSWKRKPEWDARFAEIMAL